MLSPCRAFGLSERILRARSTLTRACSQPTHTCRDRGKRQKRRVPLAARSDCRNALFARVQFSRAPALSRRTHAARRNRHSTPKAELPISQKPICPSITFSPSRSDDTPRSRPRRFRAGTREAVCPTRRIASITSSAGMISPTPESARFAAHGAEARSILARRVLFIQPARRAAALAGFAQGRGKLSAPRGASRRSPRPRA